MPDQATPRLTVTGEIRRGRDDLEGSIHELYGPDSALNLERRLRDIEDARAACSADYEYVPIEEVCRVLALAEGPLLPATRRYLKAYSDGDRPRKRAGRKAANSLLNDTINAILVNYFDEAQARLTALAQRPGKRDPLERAAAILKIMPDAYTPAKIAQEMTRRRFRPHIASTSSIGNLITKIRKELS